MKPWWGPVLAIVLFLLVLASSTVIVLETVNFEPMDHENPINR